MNRSLRKALQVGLYSLLLTAVGCSEPGNDEETPSSKRDQREPAVDQDNQQNQEALANVHENATEQVNGAITELAQYRQVEESEISVWRAATVTWSSGALGCPDPDMSYIDALVPGLWVVLQIGDEYFYYHGNDSDPLVRCPVDRMQPPALPPAKDDVM